MAAFMSSKILDNALFSSKTSRPVFYIGKPTVGNGGCSFRSIHWSPRDSLEERRLLVFRNTTPVEIFRGIHHNGGTQACSNTDANYSRDSVALKLSSPDFCSQLLDSLRETERELEAKLRADGDRNSLLRITKPDATEPSQIVTWFNLKYNLPCDSFRADIAGKVLYEIPIASLVGLTGFYVVAIQATSLYLPRGASNWRMAFAVRALVYISDPSRPPISGARGLESSFPGFCVVTTPPPDTPQRVPALPDCSKEEAVSAPARARKRKSSPPSGAKAKKQREIPVDWVECPPAKNLQVWPIKEASSKIPKKHKTAPKKQNEPQPKKIATTSSKNSGTAKLQATKTASPTIDSTDDEDSDAEERESNASEDASLESDN